jgi:RimJ/RimL family protein N-acetyltransferase
VTTLETDRLLLRPWRLDDFDAFAAMSADPEVMRFLAADGRPLTRFAAWQGLCALVGHWQLRGFGLFAVAERSTGALVGRVGPWHPEGWPAFEIGWTLRSEYWGRGYATEAVTRCLAHAFTDLGRTHVTSFIDPDNIRSIRVAQRVGEKLEGRVALPHLPHRSMLRYGLHRDEWQDRRGAAEATRRD